MLILLSNLAPPPPPFTTMLWRRRSLLKCIQFYQRPLERDDATRCEPGHRRLTVAVAPRVRVRVCVRRRRKRFHAALLDERAGVAEHFRKAALLAVQPTDLLLERAERNFERAANKAARQDVCLLVVEATVDDALLCPTKLVVCGLTKPTIR